MGNTSNRLVKRNLHRKRSYYLNYILSTTSPDYCSLVFTNIGNVLSRSLSMDTSLYINLIS